MKYSGGGMDFPCMEHLHKLIFVVFVWAVPPGGGGGVLPRILDRGVPRRFVDPNPI